MSKRNKQIATISILGDQHGEDTTYVWFNTCGQFDTTHNADKREPKHKINRLLHEGYKKGVQASNLDDIYQKIGKLIIEKQPETLVKILKNDFIYAGKISTKRQASNPSHDDWCDITTETWAARPILEALFVDHFDYFYNFVDLLIKENKTTFFQAFISGKAHTDLDNDSLFLWNQQIQNEITASLEQMKDNGHSLKKSSEQPIHRKGELLVTIAEELLKKVKQRAPTITNDVVSQFETLKFKLDLLHDLHQHDKAFNADHQWTRQMGEARSILFSPGIANIFTYAREEPFLFFNNIKPQQSGVSADLKVIDITPEERISQSPS